MKLTHAKWYDTRRTRTLGLACRLERRNTRRAGVCPDVNMAVLIGVRLSPSGRIDAYDAGELDLSPREAVVVETMAGPMLGWVATHPGAVPDPASNHPTYRILRRAAAEDIDRREALRPRERHALQVCRERVLARQLPMKLIDTQCSLDGSSLYVNFASETRVDFRGLVRDVASALRARVVFHQVGVRDHARAVDGLGPCGERICCARFLASLEPISIKMAKDQSLSITPEKFSGICGKLMCCLRFEHDSYIEDERETEASGSTKPDPHSDPE